MPERSSQDRLYTAILMAFLAALVGLGLIGVPALLVAAVGLGAATLAIALFHRRPGARPVAARRPVGKRSPVPAKYVPSVLERSSMRRRRALHLRRRHQPERHLRLR
jgi:hypothetical protein